MRIKNNLDSLVYDKVMDGIIQGEYKMGQQILAADLAQKFEISKTPVTQAIKLLCNDGVFEMLSSGHIEVPELTIQDVKNVCDVRTLFETYAIHEIFCNPSKIDKQIAELRMNAEKCKECCERHDYLGLTKMDLKFHRLIVRDAGNEFLVDMYRKVQGKFVVASYLVHPLINREFEDTINDHFKLLDLIHEGNEQEAKDFITNHINKVRELILSDQQNKNTDS